MKKYVAMVGMAGCMPEWSDEFDNLEEAQAAVVNQIDEDGLLKPEIRQLFNTLGAHGDEAMAVFAEQFAVPDDPFNRLELSSDFPKQATSTWYAEIVAKAEEKSTFKPYPYPKMVGKTVTKVINRHIFEGKITQAEVREDDIHLMVEWHDITMWVPSKMLSSMPKDGRSQNPANEDRKVGLYTLPPLGPQVCLYLKAEVHGEDGEGRLMVLAFFDTLTTPEVFGNLGYDFDLDGDKIG